MKSTRRQGHLKEIAPGKWNVRVSVGQDAGGKRVRLDRTIYGSKADAQRFLNAAQKRRDDGLDVILSRQALGAWTAEWLKTWCDSMSTRTRDDYERLLRRYLTPELRGRRLSDLSATEIQRWVNQLSARGLAPRTVRMAHGTLRTALNRAVRLGKVTRNVATLVDLPRNHHVERKFLSPDDAVRFLTACSEDKTWGAYFALLVLSGLRPSEALALRWSDLEGDMMRVRRALVRVQGKAPVEGSTKTGHSRSIPLSPTASEVLRIHRTRQLERRLELGPSYHDIGLIFPNDVGGYADLHNISARHFHPIVIRIGMTGLRLYDLRHSHASLLLAAGEHPKVVQERLGHASITLTLDTYSHVIPAMQERAGMRLEDVLQQAQLLANGG